MRYVFISRKDDDMGERKALVVGINDYPTCPLRGCCNDSEAIKDLLSNHGKGDQTFPFGKRTMLQQKVS